MTGEPPSAKKAIKLWDAEARKAGVRDKVFVQSMSDIFERFDGPVTERVQKVDRVRKLAVGRLEQIKRLAHLNGEAKP